jgi:hypothetical protein
MPARPADAEEIRIGGHSTVRQWEGEGGARLQYSLQGAL